MGMAFQPSRFEAAWAMVQSCGCLDPVDFTPERLVVGDRLPSTNQTAWQLLQQGQSPTFAVLAEEQTAGRGQWGRQWTSPPGGLYLSVALAVDVPVEQAAQLTLCTAWGIATGLRRIPAQLSGSPFPIPVQLKWLNDLVLQGRKLGGILTETRMQQGRVQRAIVGVGLNWTNPVPEMGIALASYLANQTLANQTVPLIESLELLTAIVLQGLLHGYTCWQNHGIAPILPQYWELLEHRDRPLELNGRSGSLIGITASGDLRVQFDQPERQEVLMEPGSLQIGYRPQTP